MGGRADRPPEDPRSLRRGLVAGVASLSVGEEQLADGGFEVVAGA